MAVVAGAAMCCRRRKDMGWVTDGGYRFITGRHASACTSVWQYRSGSNGTIPCTVALVGITAGTLYQKRYCADMPLAAGGVVQYAACGLVYFPIALFTETMHVEWTGEFIFALGWLVLVLSVAAIGLLYTMIRHGESARVASFFFLTPPVTAVMAWVLFGEAVTPAAWIGLALTAVGVALVTRR